jgi:hypothetical protein
MPSTDELCAQLDGAIARANEMMAENAKLRSVLRDMVDTCGAGIEEAWSEADCPEHFAAINEARTVLAS